nr:non-ribosomal peptide synthetase [uncultured Clostridium sp.]
MTNITDLIEELKVKNILLFYEDDKIKIVGSKSLLNEKLLQELKNNREDIIMYLKNVSDEKQHIALAEKTQNNSYPMSAAQKRMFLLNKMDATGVTYNTPVAFQIQGSINVAKMEKCINFLCERHEILRTVFTDDGDTPIQKILKEIKFSLEHETVDASLVESCIENFVQPFQLDQLPLFRCKLLKTDEVNHVFMLDMHHIITDGVSMEILTREFIQLYRGNQLDEIKIQYKDYTVWQNKRRSAGVLKKQEEYWLNMFEGDIPVLNLSPDLKRPAIQSYEGSRIKFHLGKELTAGIKRIAKQKGSTSYMVLLSVVNVLLSKYSGQEDILIGSPTAGRSHADLDKVVGLFVNTVVMRNRPQSGKNYLDFLAEVKGNALKAYENQDYQFDELIEILNIPRDISRNPLFDVMFSMETMGGADSIFGDLKVKEYEQTREISKFDLTFSVAESNGDFQVIIEYCTKLFKKDTMERCKGHFIRLIECITEHPDRTLAEIDMLTDDEKNQLVHEFNNKKAVYDEEPLHRMFEEQVKKAPHHIAVKCGNESVTYENLNQSANRLAAYLKKAGVKEENLAAVMMERSPDLVRSGLAIWKAQGTYMPVDPGYPLQRKINILEDARCGFVITKSEYVDEAFKKSYKGRIICLDEEKDLIEKEKKDDLNLTMDMGSLAYVLFTSGSTGRPKGVMIEHRGMMNHIHAEVEELGLKEGFIFAQNAGHCFDISVWQLFGALAVGGTTAIYPDEVVLNPEGFLKQIMEDEVELLEVVPTYLTALMDCMEEENIKPEGLKYLMVTGEAVNGGIIKRWFTLCPDIKVINAYGPAEASDDITQHIMTGAPKGGSVPIGTPLSNVQIYITDKDMNLCPAGVSGEICVAGICVGRGYIHDEERTKEVFIENPFVKERGVRLYKTGDIGRKRQDGSLEYIGRKDFQVKIRGFRIEIGEIENCLLKHEGIKEAIVVDFEDEVQGKYLCGYYTGESPLNPADLRKYLSRELTEYMIPSYFIWLKELPLSPNGKIDRKGLIKPLMEECAAEEFTEPESEEEHEVLKIWQEILGIEKISTGTSFFEIGGHSLKASAMVGRIHKQFNVQIPLMQIFKEPTIREIANYISRQEKNSYHAILPAKEKRYYPLSSQQRRLYILNKLDEEGITYNMPFTLIIEGSFSVERFTSALNQLLQRHEILRTSFLEVDGKPLQNIAEESLVNIKYEKLTGYELKDVLENFIQPFSLNQGPLLRVQILEETLKKYIVMFDMHHIITDGVSLEILTEEFIALYRGNVLENRAIQYKDYSEWQANLHKSGEMKKQEEYWLSIFKNEIPVLNMETDFKRPAIQSYEGASMNFKLGEHLTKELNSFAQKTESTMYMLLLSAVNILLSKYSGQEDILIGCPVAGRSHHDLDGAVGLFVNTLVMRNYPSGNKNYLDFLKEVKENALKAYENQDYQFEELVEKLKLRRDISRNPMFDVMFSIDNISKTDRKFTDVTVKQYESERTISKFDLTFSAVELKHDILIDIEYATKLFRPETILRSKRHFMKILLEMLKEPNRTLAEIDMLTADEKNQLVHEFNNKKAVYDEEPLHRMFEAQVKKAPHHIAVKCGNESVTYENLNQSANRLAAYLKKAGVKEENLAAVMMERSPDLVRSGLAIWKAQGTYMPVDPGYPLQRKINILEDARCGFVITKSEYVDEAFKKSYKGRIICLDEEKDLIEKEKKDDLNLTMDMGSLAYVLFTSGSTGRPKGVMIEHRGMMNHIHAEVEELGLKEGFIFAQNAGHCFDISVWQLFGALAVGGTTAIYPDEVVLNPEGFLKQIMEDEVELLEVVPTYLTALMDCMEEENIKPEGLKYLMVTGEAVNGGIIKRWFTLCPDIKVINAYGPAEASDDITQHIMTGAPKGGSVPIGTPLSNVQIYITDKDMNLCPAGVSGEICVAGICVGRGYIHDEERTKEVFIENPFVKERGVRLYKTGDIGRMRPDGSLEYIGRKDFQVKIRGFRIETGEIENCLLKHEGIKEVIVIDIEDEGQGKYLCAYYTGEGPLKTTELREHLLKELAEYMIPSCFMFLEELPLSANGKVDRRKLPDPDRSADDIEYVLPQDEIQEIVVSVYNETLGISEIGMNHNFFEIGGDSIKALQIVSRLSRKGLKLEIKDIFSNPILKDVCTKIKQKTLNLRNNRVVEGKTELLPIQRAFFMSNKEERDHFNQAVMLYREAGFEEEVLREVFHKITEHHDAFRMRYTMENKTILQYNRGLGDRVYDLYTVDLNGEVNEKDAVLKVADELQKETSVFDGKLMKLCLFKSVKGDHLLIVVHHLIIDGVSWRILFEDFEHLYKNISAGNPISLEYKTDSYQNYGNFLVNYARSDKLKKELPFWREIARAKCVGILTENSILVNTYGGSQTESISLSKEDTQSLMRNVNRTYKTEINDILLTALSIALRQLTGGDRIKIKMEGHGRETLHEDLDISRTIGWFTTLYPVLIDLEGETELSQNIKMVKESLRKIPNQGIGYGILKYMAKDEVLLQEEDAPILFNYLGEIDNDITTEVFSPSCYSCGKSTGDNVQRDARIEMDSIIIHGELVLNTTYHKKEYGAEQIARLNAAYMECLKRVIEHCMNKEKTEQTPSDYGYNKISLGDLENLLSEYE